MTHQLWQIKTRDRRIQTILILGLFLTLSIHQGIFTNESSPAPTIPLGFSSDYQITRYEFTGTVSAGLSVDSSAGLQQLHTKFDGSLTPFLRNQPGFVFTSNLVVLTRPETLDSWVLELEPGISNLHYRLVFGNNPSQSTSVLTSLSLGRISRQDVLGIFSPLVVDGLRFVYGSSTLELDLTFGYQGFLFNEPGSIGYGERLQFLSSPTNTEPDLIPFAPLWDNEVPKIVRIKPGPSVIISDLRLVFPELLGRQNLFFTGGYAQSLHPNQPLNSSNNLFQGYGLAGSTGPLSTQSFYTLALGFSHLSVPGLSKSEETGFAVLGNLRTYLPGSYGPRIGFTGFASTPHFILPVTLTVTPDSLSILESAAWFTSLDIEGILFRSPLSPRLGFSWSASVFGAGKTALGPGLLKNASLLDLRGIFALGGNLGFRYRPLRDLGFTLNLGAIAPWDKVNGSPVFQADLGLTFSF